MSRLVRGLRAVGGGRIFGPCMGALRVDLATGRLEVPARLPRRWTELLLPARTHDHELAAGAPCAREREVGGASAWSLALSEDVGLLWFEQEKDRASLPALFELALELGPSAEVSWSGSAGEAIGPDHACAIQLATAGTIALQARVERRRRRAALLRLQFAMAPALSSRPDKLVVCVAARVARGVRAPALGLGLEGAGERIARVDAGDVQLRVLRPLRPRAPFAGDERVPPGSRLSVTSHREGELMAFWSVGERGLRCYP